MSWDPIWDDIFKERKQWGKYPIEDLVRFIAKNYYNRVEKKAVKILEIGCGPGGGPSWYIAREGFSYYGIDGSINAIDSAKKRFTEEGLTGEFLVGDFEHLPWDDGTFDAVIDVVSLQCNSETATGKIIKEILRVLKKGGLHFSYTAKNGTWGDGTGERIDTTTFKNVIAGPFADMGVIRFASEESIKTLYKDFGNMNIEYITRTMDNCTKEISHWIISCQKK